MDGEIGVHNDAPLVNGIICEDLGMDGAVTIKELKGLPDCGCGGCNGVVDLGSIVSGPVVACGMDNGILSGKDRKAVRLAAKGGVDGVGADQKEIVENGRVEGEDRIGSCVGEDAEVKRCENGVLEKGDCGVNGYVHEVEVDVVEGKRGDDLTENCVGVDAEVKRCENGVLENGDCGANGHVHAVEVDVVEGKLGEVLETRSVAEEHRENGVLENGVSCADAIVQASRVEVLENNGCGAKTKNVEEAGIGDLNNSIDCNGEDHSLSNGVAWGEKLSGSQGCKAEAIVVEHQKGSVDDTESVNELIAVGSESESAEGLSGGAECHPDADTQVACEELVVDQPDPGLPEGVSQTEGSMVVESADVQIHNVEKSDEEIPKSDKAEAASPVSIEQILSAIQPLPDHMSESNLCCSADVEPHKVVEADIEAVNADDQVKNVEKVEVESRDISVEDANSLLENLSTEEADAAKSDSPIESHHDDASMTVTESESTVTVLEVPSTVECSVASEEKDPELVEGNVQEVYAESSSVAAKEEPVPLVVGKDGIKNEVMDSGPSETTAGSGEENNSTTVDVFSSSLAGNAIAEAVICFGSFSQSDFSGTLNEDVTEKKDDQHIVPDQDIEQSSPQAEVVDVTPQSDVVVAEVPAVASPKEQTQVPKVEKRAFNYLIKTPRFEDDLLKSKISDAQLLVDEKTKIRDAIKAEMHGKKSTYKESSEKFGAAVLEEKAARELLKSKRRDVDSVQNEINKVKNAMSLGEIDAEITDMDRSIQHETLPLKEERELINKIRKLKQLRGQMSSSVGGEDELRAAVNRREETEERLKVLKRDLETLRENCLKAEAVTKATKKIYYDDNEKLRELQTRFKDADEIRQDAYLQLQSLKKELYEKNKPFWKYRDDMKMATDLASIGDRESLSQFCVQQVETFMEAWNKSSEFKEEYLKSNAGRTLRRLGTADGRSLGPNEEAPSIPPIINEKPAPGKSFPPLVTPKLETAVQTVKMEEASADEVMRKDTDKKKRKPKAKNTVKAPTEIETVLAILERDETAEEAKELEVTEEEREQARKVEELRKKEEEANLLEQRRMEEKAKEKEALERKRRNAERASVRATQKAQKEAEQKEKEREKRARKKEKKRLGSGDAASSDDIPDGVQGTPSEVTVEPATPAETKLTENPTPTRKPSRFAKHTKIAPIPAPLRNRGKRKMQPWMWVVAVALLVLALFLAGNARNLF